MRAALLSVRSVRALPVLPVLSRSSARARAPSRLASTEASVPATPLSKHIAQFVPTAAILTLLISIASVSAYYNGELMALKKEIEGTKATLTKQLEGTAATFKSDMAGTAGKLEERVTGLKDAITNAVDAKNAGSERVVDAKITAFKEAADLKVRFLLRARARTIDPLSHAPPPPLLQYKAK